MFRLFGILKHMVPFKLLLLNRARVIFKYSGVIQIFGYYSILKMKYSSLKISCGQSQLMWDFQYRIYKKSDIE